MVIIIILKKVLLIMSLFRIEKRLMSAFLLSYFPHFYPFMV